MYIHSCLVLLVFYNIELVEPDGLPNGEKESRRITFGDVLPIKDLIYTSYTYYFIKNCFIRKTI